MKVKPKYEKRKREKSRIIVVQMNNLRAMTGVGRSDRMRNEGGNEEYM